MTSSMRADVKEYIPSWARKSTPAAAPPPPQQKSGFTTSMTSTNVVTTHNSSTPIYMPTAHPAGGLPMRSPTAALRFPTRMSPMHAPFPPVSSTMNPDAKDFIPHLSGANSLAPLPTSTAELAEEKERQQKQQSKSSVNAKWRSNSEKNSDTHPTMSPAFKASFTPPVAPIVVEKSEEEIIEISKRSELKVGAPAFVPRRTLNRIRITKPSPSSQAQSSSHMPLGDVWCLFFLPASGGESIRENTYDPTHVFSVDSVPTFWKIFNNVAQPTDMNYGTLYFFRDGINPKWEDPGNRDGGIVKLKVPSASINDAWVLLLCRTIGESWSKSARNTVNGVALKVRERAYLLEVWVTQQTPELMADISELMQPFLGEAFSVLYSPHSVTQEKAAAVAAALAEKGKKNRNNRRRW
ncbi:Translation Initiation factor eIF- 4e [Trypanosoma melophagium]|uniref:Translation Initiation factor eIF- 4e n=1 Tax=Trypanosoma melophagium TaxID=715481 RepID=UPI00351A07ED|nr:Translation Initiation factor eIF- 4e [Trypanosoma melophagium]